MSSISSDTPSLNKLHQQVRDILKASNKPRTHKKKISLLRSNVQALSMFLKYEKVVSKHNAEIEKLLGSIYHLILKARSQSLYQKLTQSKTLKREFNIRKFDIRNLTVYLQKKNLECEQEIASGHSIAENESPSLQMSSTSNTCSFHDSLVGGSATEFPTTMRDDLPVSFKAYSKHYSTFKTPPELKENDSSKKEYYDSGKGL
ncbi:uncharacterized protein MONOS_17034 [Monocercomonoides exilis]|uniref:uncharacterized protein n=1 Tax=Monocercomonoides exilis TaxID=2049356 RepID=UPI003559CAF1|nr:hypothetical protein MONOS_17034 [Monocercomonoides exilis]